MDVMGGREEVVVSSRSGSSMLFPHTKLSRFRLRPRKNVVRSKRLKPSSLKKKERFVPCEDVVGECQQEWWGFFGEVWVCFEVNTILNLTVMCIINMKKKYTVVMHIVYMTLFVG